MSRRSLCTMQYRLRFPLFVLALCGAACGGSDRTGVLPDGPAPLDAAVLDATAPDATMADAAASDGGCVPTSPAAEVCDGIDNDCDGLVDNVDVAGDGIYDCQRVLFLGTQGAQASSSFEAWAHSNGTTVTRLVDPSVTVDAALLAAYDIVLIDRVGRLYTADEAAALATWVHAGGGVMALSGYSGGPQDQTFPNSLVVQLGVQFTGALLSGPVTMFTPHPLSTGLTSVTFSGGFPVMATASAEQPIVVGQIGTTPVAIATPYGSGRVYLWGDEWVTFDSQWAGSIQILQFWVDAFGWLGKFR